MFLWFHLFIYFLSVVRQSKSRWTDVQGFNFSLLSSHISSSYFRLSSVTFKALFSVLTFPAYWTFTPSSAFCVNISANLPSMIVLITRIIPLHFPFKVFIELLCHHRDVYSFCGAIHWFWLALKLEWKHKMVGLIDPCLQIWVWGSWLKSFGPK